MLPSKFGVAHALGVLFEIVGLGAKLVEYLGIGGLDGVKRRHQLFDFALVEVF